MFHQKPRKKSNNRGKGSNTERIYERQDRIHSKCMEIKNVCVTKPYTLRFAATSGASAIPQNITYQNLLDAVCIATTTTNLVQAFQMVKVRAVRVWAQPTTASTAGAAPVANKASVEFEGTTVGQMGDGLIAVNLSMGVEPAFVQLIAPKTAQCSQWQVSANTVAFRILCPPGGIVDVDLTFRNTYGSAQNTQSTGAGLSAGSWYFRGLDGISAASTTLFPALSSAVA